MGNVVVGIHQPNFMPWLGYFYKISQSDIFIFLDDVQIQKTGSNYTNRVSVNINGKASYITVPVKRKEGTWNINETEFVNNKWRKKIIGTLEANYSKAPYFKENKDLIFNLVNYEVDNLAQYNMNFIIEMSKKLELNTIVIQSSQFELKTTSTQRLVDLIKTVNGNIYLSGSGGSNYQEEKMYIDEKIELIYNKMPSFKYEQFKTNNFIGGLSIIDVIFNVGFDSLKETLFNG